MLGLGFVVRNGVRAAATKLATAVDMVPRMDVFRRPVYIPGRAPRP